MILEQFVSNRTSLFCLKAKSVVKRDCNHELIIIIIIIITIRIMIIIITIIIIIISKTFIVAYLQCELKVDRLYNTKTMISRL